jgi:hypothetical protein
MGGSFDRPTHRAIRISAAPHRKKVNAEMESRAKNAIVVGMPRSGTSMTAGIFAREGYFIAADPSSELREGDEHNPGGYWEADAVIEANVRLFEAIGYGGHNTWLFEPITPGAAQALAAVAPPPENLEVLREYQRNAPWLWKDPRLCYTLGHWWRLMDPDRTRVLLLRRDPDAIHRSFVRLGWRDSTAESREDVLRRVDDHLAAARWAIERFEIPHVEIDYEDFQNRPDFVASLLRETFGFDVSGDQLGYAKTLNRSSWLGRVTERARRASRRVPAPLSRAVKRLLPRRILRVLLPEKY